MATTDRKEWRKQVTLGPLPADFLCVGPSNAEHAQTAADVATAQMLQQQCYMSFVPPNTQGRLSITIQEAKLTRNYGLVRMDPYCRLRIANTVFETPTHPSGGRTPRWNRTVHWVQEWRQGEEKEGMVNLVLQMAPLDAPSVAYVPVTGPGVFPPPAGAVPAAGGAPVVNHGPPPGPLYTPEDVAELREMFPMMTDDVISSVLDEKRGNKDAAVNALLVIAEEADVKGDNVDVQGDAVAEKAKE